MKLQHLQAGKKKSQLSILNKGTNTSARHEIDSKLKTMRMRITENSAGVGGGGGGVGGEGLILYFHKVCYLHKDYVKTIGGNIPKAFSTQSAISLPLHRHKTNSTCNSEQMCKGTRVSEKNICRSVCA